MTPSFSGGGLTFGLSFVHVRLGAVVARASGADTTTATPATEAAISAALNMGRTRRPAWRLIDPPPSVSARCPVIATPSTGEPHHGRQWERARRVREHARNVSLFWSASHLAGQLKIGT